MSRRVKRSAFSVGLVVATAAAALGLRAIIVRADAGPSVVTLPIVENRIPGAEAAELIRSTLDGQQVRAAIEGARFEVIGAIPVEDIKGDIAACRGVSCARIILWHYEKNLALHALVDRKSRRILAVHESAAQPPITANEGIRAHNLAEADPVIKPLAALPHTHPGQATGAMHVTQIRGPCATDRCAVVIFAIEGGRLAHVLVDLTSETIVERLIR